MSDEQPQDQAEAPPVPDTAPRPTEEPADVDAPRPQGTTPGGITIHNGERFATGGL